MGKNIITPHLSAKVERQHQRQKSVHNMTVDDNIEMGIFPKEYIQQTQYLGDIAFLAYKDGDFTEEIEVITNIPSNDDKVATRRLTEHCSQ